nr:uncharacterized protein LOC127484640 isoform X2 [Oryctolagus cuniculus]
MTAAPGGRGQRVSVNGEDGLDWRGDSGAHQGWANVSLCLGVPHLQTHTEYTSMCLLRLCLTFWREPTSPPLRTLQLPTQDHGILKAQRADWQMTSGGQVFVHRICVQTGTTEALPACGPFFPLISAGKGLCHPHVYLSLLTSEHKQTIIQTASFYNMKNFGSQHNRKGSYLSLLRMSYQQASGAASHWGGGRDVCSAYCYANGFFQKCQGEAEDAAAPPCRTPDPAFAAPGVYHGKSAHSCQP